VKKVLDENSGEKIIVDDDSVVQNSEEQNYEGEEPVEFVFEVGEHSS
jgi:hypothetical protein